MSQPLRIFILEDDQLIKFAIVNVLKQAGFSQLRCAENAMEATKVLTEFTPDLAILDITIGEENQGFDVAEMLSVKEIPYFFLSGNKEINILKEAATKAPMAYLMKPVDSDVLIANIMVFQDKLEKFLAESVNEEPLPLILRTISGVVNIFEDDIAYVESENVYINLYLKDNKHLVVRSFLNPFLEKLKSKSIIKVHRSFAINACAFTKYKGKTIVVNNREIPVSKTFKSNLEARIQVI